MSQQQRDAVDQIMRNSPLDIGGDPTEQRAVFEQMLASTPLPADVVLTPGEAGGVPTLDLAIDATRTEKVLLWLHGGWYVMGSPRTSAALSADLARRAGARVVSVDYRLAPEHPAPAALEDALAAYRGLLADGVDPAAVAIVGESAGGGLAAAALASLGREGLPQPACSVLFSPWTDLTLSGESMKSKVGVDPAFRPEEVRVRADDYVGRGDPSDPAISPLFADLRGLPPTMIQAGAREILLDDSSRLAARLAASEVAVTLDVTPGVPHLFQVFAPLLEEGDSALDRVATFLAAHLSG